MRRLAEAISSAVGATTFKPDLWQDYVHAMHPKIKFSLLDFVYFKTKVAGRWEVPEKFVATPSSCVAKVGL